MPGIREAALLGASVAVTGGLAFALWSYARPTARQGPPDAERSAAETDKERRSLVEVEVEVEVLEEEQEQQEQQEEQEEQEQPAVKTAAEETVDALEKTAATVQKAAANEVLMDIIKARPARGGTQVLVLGLEGAGKTCLLHCFASGGLEQEVEPTQGFNAVSINKEDLQIEFLEIGGQEHLRPYWQRYLCRALVLVFVVDSSSRQLFPLAKQHLHELVAGDPCLPLVVLANKQDVPGACSITDLHDALCLAEVGDRRQLFLIGTAVRRGGAELNAGVRDARDLILQMVCGGK